jgi:hypothetical protein
MGVAGGRPRAPGVLARPQPVRGRPAPWRGRRRRRNGAGARSCHRPGHVRRPGSDPRADGHDFDRGRLPGLADPSRDAARPQGRPCPRGRPRGRGRPVGGGRARRPLRPPGRPRGGERRVRRPAHAPSAADSLPSPAGARGATRARAGSRAPSGARAHTRTGARARTRPRAGGFPGVRSPYATVLPGARASSGVVDTRSGSCARPGRGVRVGTEGRARRGRRRGVGRSELRGVAALVSCAVEGHASGCATPPRRQRARGGVVRPVGGASGKRGDSRRAGPRASRR